MIFEACGTVVWFHVSVQVILIYGCCSSDSSDEKKTSYETLIYYVL